MLLSLFIFGIFKGYSLDTLVSSGLKSGKKALLVIKIFVLVGAISSLWINAGTIPGIVYYGVKFINPSYYYLLVFLITCTVSFFLGSSFGTVGTVGIALMAVGKGIGADPNIAGGAIISGSFWGDRCSPVSSSANLVAVLTESNLYKNIKNMLRTSLLPSVINCVILWKLGGNLEPKIVGSNLDKIIAQNFSLNHFIFIPVFIILMCALFKINVKISMGLSVISAFVLGIVLQGYSFISLITSLLLGFSLEKTHQLADILKGGGVFSMWKACLIVGASCIMAGVLNELKLLKSFDAFLYRGQNRFQIFLNTLFLSIVTSALGCNQSISVVMTTEIMKPIYEKKNIDKDSFALDIENSSIVIPALIPWNIAGLIPAGMLGLTSLKYIPYSFYLYILPLTMLIIFKLKYKKVEGVTNESQTY